MNSQPSILIAENDQNIASLLVGFLKEKNYKVSHTNDGQKVQAILKDKHFDIVLLSDNLQYIEGSKLLPILKNNYQISQIPIIMLTNQKNEDYLVNAIDNGAEDCITKPIKTKTLLARIKSVLRRTYQQSKINIQMPKGAKIAEITSKEIEILKLIAEGLNNQEIADKLVLSTNTIANHIKSIFAKLKTSNRTLSALIAIKYNII